LDSTWLGGAVLEKVASRGVAIVVLIVELIGKPTKAEEWLERELDLEEDGTGVTVEISFSEGVKIVPVLVLINVTLLPAANREMAIDMLGKLLRCYQLVRSMILYIVVYYCYLLK
jgi:hypothetical protein